MKGLIWDAENYSCAYDALYTILFNIWEFNPSKWNTVFGCFGPFAANLVNGFKDIQSGRTSFELVRNNIRHQIHCENSEHFPYGQNGTDIGDLIRTMFPNPEHSVRHQATCIQCNRTNTLFRTPDLASVIYVKNSKGMTAINKLFQIMQQHIKPCSTCDSPMNITQKYNGTPNILIFMPSGHKVSISKNIRVLAMNGLNTFLPVRGIIYLKDFHFTTLLITPGKEVWYHDGRTTGEEAELKGNLEDFSEKKLYQYRNKRAVAIIYAKK